MTPTFSIVIAHRCYVAGRTAEPGEVFALPADVARALIDCGRGALVNAADAKALGDALSTEFQRQQTEAAGHLRELEREHRPKARIGFLP